MHSTLLLLLHATVSHAIPLTRSPTTPSITSSPVRPPVTKPPTPVPTLPTGTCTCTQHVGLLQDCFPSLQPDKICAIIDPPLSSACNQWECAVLYPGLDKSGVETCDANFAGQWSFMVQAEICPVDTCALQTTTEARCTSTAQCPWYFSEVRAHPECVNMEKFPIPKAFLPLIPRAPIGCNPDTAARCPPVAVTSQSLPPSCAKEEGPITAYMYIDRPPPPGGVMLGEAIKIGQSTAPATPDSPIPFFEYTPLLQSGTKPDGEWTRMLVLCFSNNWCRSSASSPDPNIPPEMYEMLVASANLTKIGEVSNITSTGWQCVVDNITISTSKELTGCQRTQTGWLFTTFSGNTSSNSTEILASPDSLTSFNNTVGILNVTVGLLQLHPNDLIQQRQTQENDARQSSVQVAAKATSFRCSSQTSKAKCTSGCVWSGSTCTSGTDCVTNFKGCVQNPNAAVQGGGGKHGRRLLASQEDEFVCSPDFQYHTVTMVDPVLRTEFLPPKCGVRDLYPAGRGFAVAFDDGSAAVFGSTAMFGNRRHSLKSSGHQPLSNSEDYYSGDNFNEMGSSLGLLPVAKDVQRLVLAWTYGFALLSTNVWVSFGSDLYGAQGIGRTTYKTAAKAEDPGTRVTVVVGEFPDERGDNLPIVNIGVPIIDIHVGIEDTVFQRDTPNEYEFWLEDGTSQRSFFRGVNPSTGTIGVKAAGLNWYGALGLGITSSTFGEDPQQVGNGMPWIDLCWSTVDVIDVAGGSKHTCFLSSTGNVKCAGYAPLLGLSTTQDHGSTRTTTGCFLPQVNVGLPVVAIVAGQSATCVLTSISRVKCWGLQNLGLGSNSTWGTAYGVNKFQMGAALPFVQLGDDGNAQIVSLVAGPKVTSAITSTGLIYSWGVNAGKDNFLGASQFTERIVGDAPNQMGKYLNPVSFGGIIATKIVHSWHSSCVLSSTFLVYCWGAYIVVANPRSNIGPDLNAVSPYGTSQGSTVHEWEYEYEYIGDSPTEFKDLKPLDLVCETETWLTMRVSVAPTSFVASTSAPVGSPTRVGFKFPTIKPTTMAPTPPTPMPSRSPTYSFNCVPVDIFPAEYGFYVLVQPSGRVRFWGYRINAGDVWDPNTINPLKGKKDSVGASFGSRNVWGDVASQEGVYAHTLVTGTKLKVVKVVATSTYGFVLLQDGLWRMWGTNANGQLGNGVAKIVGIMPGVPELPIVNIGNTKHLVIVDIVTAYDRTAVLIRNIISNMVGVKTFGDNISGALGLGIRRKSFGSSSLHESGDGLPWVNLCWDQINVTKAAIGHTHTCFLNANGDVKCVGNVFAAGVSNSSLSNGTFVRWGENNNTVGCFLPKVALSWAAIDIKAAADHTCAMVLTPTQHIQVACWGNDVAIGSGPSVLTLGGPYPNSELLKMIANNILPAGSSWSIPLVSLPSTVTNVLDMFLADQCVTIMADNGLMYSWGVCSAASSGMFGFTAAGMGDNLPPASFAAHSIIKAARTINGFCVLNSTLAVKCIGDLSELGNSDTIAEITRNNEVYAGMSFSEFEASEPVAISC